MFKHGLLAACAITAATSIASAQTSTPPAAQSNPSASGTQGGSGGVAQTMVRFYQVKPEDAVVSNWTGVNVANAQDETIGEIKDVVVDSNKSLRAVIVSVGGFLGIGGRYVAVEPDSLRFITGSGGGLRAQINSTRDALMNAPEFKYDSVTKSGTAGMGQPGSTTGSGTSSPATPGVR